MLPQRQRRWPTLVVGVLIGGAVTLAAATWLGGGDDEELVQPEEVVLATALAEQRDLVEEIEWIGTLGYGQPGTVSGTGGTVTWALPAGLIVDRGDVIAAVDNQPIVVLFGDTPMWRTLSEGAEGHDVFQLESNLAVLGYDPDSTVDIDGVFTANTEAMVERWQEALGVEPTGVVAPPDVAITEGPSAIVTAADVGSSATGQLAVMAPRRGVTDIVARIDGTITTLAPEGTLVEHGTTLYEVDGVPVVALIASDPVATEFLSATFTTAELEEALSTTGYDPDGEMTVDGVITDATSAAVERWQLDARLPVTGGTDPGYYLPVPTGQAVDTHVVEAGTIVTTGGPVLTTSVSRLSVEVTVEVSEADEFDLDQDVTIVLADESTAGGIVTDIGPVTEATDPQDSPTATITIGVVASTDQSLIEGSVTVISVGEEIVGATVVPTRALVALAEGGFAVQKVTEGGTTSLIAVELGTFDDGLVEVTTGELEPGDEVVVPQ